MIDRKTVLTAAHCFVDQITVNGTTVTMSKTDFSMYKIYLGIHDNREALNGATTLTSGVRMNVVNYILVSKNHC